MWGTFSGTLVNVAEVAKVRQSSPNFARVRQSSHEGAHMLLPESYQILSGHAPEFQKVRQNDGATGYDCLILITLGVPQVRRVEIVCPGIQACRKLPEIIPSQFRQVLEDPLHQKTREGCGCPKFLAGKVFRQMSTLLETYSPIFRKHEMLSLPRFGHFSARKTAAGKLAAPSGTLLDFLLRDCHSLLEFF